MSGPLETDPVNFEPRLAARRENPREFPPSLLKGRVPGSARLVARHFASTKKTRGPRPLGSAAPGQRRVIVVCRKFLPAAAARKALASHLQYLDRDGVEPDGTPARFFDAGSDDVDSRAFAADCRDAPGHYRLMVNPEDGAELKDLSTYARRFMSAVERDVGAPMDWIATGHHDTGQPHLHILLLDRSPAGHRLALTGRYLNRGLRQAAEETATELLGPRLERRSARTIKLGRFTELDGVLIGAAVDGRVDASAIPDAHRSDALRRLVHLETRGLARAAGPAAWDIPPDLRTTLRQIGMRDAREIAATQSLRDSDWRADPSRLEAVSLEPGERLVGAFVGVHRIGPYADGSQAVVVDALDGRLAHALVRDAKAVICLDEIPPGAVIEVAGHGHNRSSDLTIAEVAAAREGVWSAAGHAGVRPDDWPRFIGFHQRRVEAMSREGACASLGDGRFYIPADYCSRAAEADAAQWGPSEVKVRVLDANRLEEQVRSSGLTWLDRLMTSRDRPHLAGGFGQAVTSALSERSARHRSSGLGSGDPLGLSSEDIAKLRMNEIRWVFERLERTGKAVFHASDGQSASGVYLNRLHISGTPYALLESRSAYHLVLWTPGMEACRGRALSAVVQQGAVSFRAVRGAGLDLGL